jgi:hypothetical protein
MADSDTHGTFDEVLRSFTHDIQEIASALRNLISSIDADFVEVAWPRQKMSSYGIGPKKMSEHYAYIAPYKEYVNLGFYHGAVLKDPDRLLEGAGQKLRHVKVRSLAEVDTKELARLLRAALLDRKKAVAAKAR